MRVRYTGSAPVCFQVPGMGLVEPGAVFEVPDGRAAGFLRRPDIEQVAAKKAGLSSAPVKKLRGPKTTSASDAGDSAGS